MKLTLVVDFGCQVASPRDVQSRLPCKEREGGGLQCERTDEHGDNHALSEHTINHSLRGNGYSCKGIPGALEPTR